MKKKEEEISVLSSNLEHEYGHKHEPAYTNWTLFRRGIGHTVLTLI